MTTVLNLGSEDCGIADISKITGMDFMIRSGIAHRPQVDLYGRTVQNCAYCEASGFKYSADWKFISSIDAVSKSFSPMKANTQYTVFLSGVSFINKIDLFKVADEDGTNVNSNVAYFNNTNRAVFQTNSITNPTTLNKLYFKLKAGQTLSSAEQSELSKLKVMILEGNFSGRDIPYAPFGLNSQHEVTAVNVGKNLLLPTMGTTTLNGLTCTSNEDGTFNVSGTATSDTFFGFHGVSTITMDKSFKVVGCPKFGRETSFRITMKNKASGTWFVDTGNGFTVNIDSKQEFSDFGIKITSGTTMSGELFKPMITTDLDDTYDDFEPYQSATISYQVDTKLKGIPVTNGGNYTDEYGQQWLCDEIKDGYYIQRIAALYFDGSDDEKWVKYNYRNGTGYYIDTKQALKTYNSAVCISNKYAVNGQDVESPTPYIYVSGAPGAKNSAINCCVNISDQTSFINSLKNYTLIVYAELETPIKTPIKAKYNTHPLTLFKGTNHIVCNVNMDMLYYSKSDVFMPMASKTTLGGVKVGDSPEDMKNGNLVVDASGQLNVQVNKVSYTLTDTAQTDQYFNDFIATTIDMGVVGNQVINGQLYFHRGSKTTKTISASTGVELGSYASIPLPTSPGVADGIFKFVGCICEVNDKYVHGVLVNKNKVIKFIPDKDIQLTGTSTVNIISDPWNSIITDYVRSA